VVSPHARHRSEDDGRHRGGNRHLHGQIRTHAALSEQIGEEGHHDHAATNAEQTGQKTCAKAQNGQFGQQRWFNHHGELECK